MLPVTIMGVMVVTVAVDGEVPSAAVAGTALDMPLSPLYGGANTQGNLSDLLKVTLLVRGRGDIEPKHLASGTHAHSIPLYCLLGLMTPFSSPFIYALCPTHKPVHIACVI